MKKLLTAIIAVIALGMSASAQEKQELKQYKKDVYKRHDRGERHRHGNMMKDLNLSEDQKKQLKDNHEAFTTQMKELNKQENITVKEMRQRKASLMKEQKQKNDLVFTSEQKEKMAQAKLKHEAEAKEHAEKRLVKMKTELALTDDQVSKLNAQNEETRAKMKAIRENENLDHETKRSEMMALKNNMKEQRKSILTPDQLKKMEESKKDRSNRPARSKK